MEQRPDQKFNRHMHRKLAAPQPFPFHPKPIVTAVRAALEQIGLEWRLRQLAAWNHGERQTA